MNFLEEIKKGRILVFDGAMGTQLAEQGVEPGGQNNLSNPDKVENVHLNYINSGADVIITNTFSGNRIYLESHEIPGNIEDINIKGVEIAKKAADSNIFVAGDISATGQMMEPFGLYTKDQFVENFKEQAILLDKAGVDLFIIETIMDLNEALCALEACKSVSKLPVVVSITFSTLANGGRTIMGNSAEECARKLTKAGADVLGANCGDLDPFEMAELIKIYKQHSTLPFLAQPNAGKPKLVNGQTVFNMKADKFAEGIQKCLEAGANLIGGCCGTSPEYIKAISKFVK